MRLVLGGFRARLLALICLSLVPVLLFSAYLAAERRSDELRQATESVGTLARLTASTHGNILAQARQTLAGLVAGTRSDDDPLLGPECAEVAREIMSMHPVYQQVAIASPSGTVYCAAVELPASANLSGFDFFYEALLMKRASNSSVIRTDLTGGEAIVLAHPVLDEYGAVVGVLLAALGLHWIDEHLSRASLPPDAAAGLLDANGQILANFRRPYMVGRTIADATAFTEAAARADEGVMENVGLDGIARILGYARLPGLPGSGVYIRIGLPASEVDKVALQTLQRMVTALGLVLAAALAAGWFGGSRLIVQPLCQLTEAAARLGRGDLTARTGLSHSTNEIGVLATKFDELAEHLQHSRRALTALSAGNRLILRERDEERLLDAMCHIVIDKAGYCLAWVACRKNDTSELKSVAHASRNEIDFRVDVWSRVSVVAETLDNVIRTGSRQIVNSVMQDQSADLPSVPRQNASLASFPLKIENTTIGAFTIIANAEHAFDVDELELLDEMSADLSFGMTTIRLDARREEAERRAEHAATHDLLTDLPNAAAFLSRVTHEVARAREQDAPLSILVVHLARLQDVYDSLGYEPANLIVTEGAKRLRGLPTVPSSLARIGLEDYAVLLARTDAGASEPVVRSILSALEAPVEASGAQFEIQPAVGASYYPGHGDSADLLVRRATIAARDAARHGLSFRPYRGATERENPERLALAAELKQAIQHRSLSVHYQPKIDLRTGRAIGCEALVRWNHPSRGAVSPMQFVPIAEQTGLIRDLTYFVVDESVHQQRRWRSDGPSLPVAINLSIRNLYDNRLLERIEGFLATWGVPANVLEFEITESALMEEPDVARAAIALLGSRGCQIYIDDFGTGYSSLSYLVSLPVHALKIDRTFVAQMTETTQAESVVASIISMAHALGLRVVAEGVETQAELDQLKGFDCDYVQGYYTGRPMPPSDFTQNVFNSFGPTVGPPN